MKKMYNAPSMEMIAMFAQDVITASGGSNEPIEQYNSRVDQYLSDKDRWI